MKAITIIQPWATLVASGAKLNETRSWKTDYRGEILIHAGKKNFTHKLILDSTDMRDFLSRAGIIWGDQKKLPTGAIIGKAALSDCVLIDQAFKECFPDSSTNFGIMVAVPNGKVIIDEFNNPTPLDDKSVTDWKLYTIQSSIPGLRSKSITELLFCMLRSGR